MDALIIAKANPFLKEHQLCLTKYPYPKGLHKTTYRQARILQFGVIAGSPTTRIPQNLYNMNPLSHALEALVASLNTRGIPLKVMSCACTVASGSRLA